MPFAFNDDKSLLDIKVIESDTGVLVPTKTLTMLDSRLISNLGITNVDDWIVIGKMFVNSDDQTKPISWKDIWDQYDDPAEGICVQFMNNERISIFGYNDTTKDQYMWYRIVLMRIH